MISSDTWVCPPELESLPKPRPVRLSKTGRTNIFVLVALVIFMFVLCTGIFTLGWKKHREFVAVQREGTAVSGTVLGKRYVGGKGAHYEVFYQYQAMNNSYRNSARVSYSDYQMALPGNPVTLRFLPSQPQISRLANEQEPPTFKFILFLPFFNLISFGFVFGQIKKHQNLLRSGDAAAASVEKVARQKNGYLIFYRFQDQMGQTIQGKASVPMKLPPNIGSTVTVLYLPNQPSQNVIYPPMMAEIAV